MKCAVKPLVPLLLGSLFLSGCGEDVGVCEDPQEGRELVLSGNKVMYGGQAVINKACAVGCHSSSAKGAARNGAPAGLDFDLLPLSEAAPPPPSASEEELSVARAALKEGESKGESEHEAEDESKGGSEEEAVESEHEGAELSPGVLALRKRRFKVISERNFIWEQVKGGLMPPRGRFASFRVLTSIFHTEKSSPCTKGEALTTLDDGESREILRSWLACGAPIVETNEPRPTPSGSEQARIVGGHFQSCEPSDGEGTTITLASLLEGPLAGCGGCHGAKGTPPDLSSVEAASALLTSKKTCEGKPYVAEGEPEGSFLIDLLRKDEPGCSHSRMPYGGPYLEESAIQRVEAWIRTGAALTEGEESSSMPASEGDHGSAEEPAEPMSQHDAGRDAGVASGADAGKHASR